MRNRIALIASGLAFALALAMLIVLSGGTGEEPGEADANEGTRAGDRPGAEPHGHEHGDRPSVAAALANGEPGFLTGTVTDAEGAALSGMSVRLSGDAWNATSRTGRAGTYRIRLPSGRAVVRVVSRTFLSSRPLAVWIPPGGEARADITLHRRTAARVILRGPGGRPLTEAGEVELEHARTGATYRVALSWDGTASLAGLSRGEYKVRVKVPGFYARGPDRGIFHVDDDAPTFETELSVSSRISGTVKTDAASAVPGATVSALGRTGPSGDVLSDERGRFVLDVPPGTVVVTVDHPDYAPAVIGSVEAVEGAWVDVSAIVTPGRSLTGRVVGPAGNGLGGSLIRLQRVGERADLYHVYDAVTADREGRFHVRHLAEGWHIVSARAAGYAAVSRKVFVGGGSSPVAVRIDLGAGRALSGSVTDAFGVSLAQVHVKAVWSGGEGETRTDDNGAFTFRGIGADRLAFTFSLDGYGAVSLAQVRANEPMPAVVLHRLGSIAGRIVWEGIGLEGVAVSAGDESGNRWRAHTGPGGEFHLQGLAPGRYRVSAAPEGFTSLSHDVAVGEGRHVSLPDSVVKAR